MTKNNNYQLNINTFTACNVMKVSLCFVLGLLVTYVSVYVWDFEDLKSSSARVVFLNFSHIVQNVVSLFSGANLER